MTTIDPAILDVAAVVLGEQRTNLRGWQRRAAVEAMTALGHSKNHIAWALNTSTDTIGNFGYIHGIPLHRHDQRPDWTAINMVAAGERMPLTGVDRDEAIRLLAAAGLRQVDIVDRLLCSDESVATIANRLGITISKAEPWNWFAYMRTGKGSLAVAA